jgi:hypothetical protein
MRGWERCRGGLDEPPRRLDGRAGRADVVVAVGGLGVATPAVRGPRGMPGWLEGRMIESPVSASMALFEGGPTLIDLLVDMAELRITMTGPRMLYERLEALT